jgi:hypothetical protein
VAYDSLDCSGIYKVYTKEEIVKTKPTPKELYAVSLKDNPEAAYLLVNDADHTFPMSPYSVPSKSDSHHVHVSTMHNNYEGFTDNKSNRHLAHGALWACLGIHLSVISQA